MTPPGSRWPRFAAGGSRPATRCTRMLTGYWSPRMRADPTDIGSAPSWTQAPTRSASRSPIGSWPPCRCAATTGTATGTTPCCPPPHDHKRARRCRVTPLFHRCVGVRSRSRRAEGRRLTAVAVLIGVALVAGTLMLTDTIGQSVRHLTATAHAGVDVAVRNADDPKAGPPQAIGPQLLAAIRAVPGVGAAAGVVVAEKLQMVGRDGRPIRHQRAVNLVTSWPDDPMLASAYTLRQGRPPARGGEVVLDAATAGQGGWQLGDTLGIVGADGRVHRFRVVGVTGFAGRDSPASQLSSFDTSTVAVLQTAAAQRLLGRGDAVDEAEQPL